ncbi:hypothetical protein LSH36_887g01056 [Paralvinella palmiformis]|uniref:Fibrinogen C-terminal domain-containing protein n=1 Tax=Paralvinella palmiformis TaxID=53620 RepID=A0AAD9MT92_9ANNE|nr:hypothetical protein LSH36_887g01056 [Paralvinella palmiformis]
MPQTTLKLVKLYHITTSCFVLLITSLAAQDSLPVRFEENSIIPDDEMFLTDYSKDTCTLFKLDDDKAEVGKRTKFRISIPELVLDEVAVSMIGSNMGCDRDLYLMPLSPNETLKWGGCWPICPLIKSGRSGNEEKCRFECQCSGRFPTSCTYFSSQQSGIYEYVIADTPNLIRREFYCDSNTDGGGWTVRLL